MRSFIASFRFLFLTTILAGTFLSTPAAALNTLVYDEFNGSDLDTTKWKRISAGRGENTVGNSSTVHDGYLDLAQNETDNGGAVVTRFAPQSHVRVSLSHNMHQGGNNFFPSVYLESAVGQQLVQVSWERSGNQPDYCNNSANYNRIRLLVAFTADWCSRAIFSSVASSSFYDRWSTAVLEYDQASGLVTVDLDGNGTIDMQATVPAGSRVPVTGVGLNGIGWFTGHWQKVDWIRVEGGAGTSDDHGNTTATATVIQPNSSTAGIINYAGDDDFFRVILAQTGTLTAGTAGSTDTYGYLLDSGGAEIARNDHANAPNFFISRLLAAGTYYVRVRHSSASGTGAYTLLAGFAPGPVDDHGNSQSSATSIQPNSTTAGRIGAPGDIDYFRVVLPEAGTLTAYTSGTIDTYGYLKDGAGQIITQDDDSAESLNFRISRLLNAGTYFIAVKHFSPGGMGDYQLVSSFAPASAGAQQVKAVLLLHGLNSGPATWDSYVNSRWAGSCPTIRAATFEDANAPRTPDAEGIYCYRVRFGTQDSTGVGLNNITCSDVTLGCSGDFTRIFTNRLSTDTGDLGQEVHFAIGAVLSDQKDRLGPTVDLRVALLGHSRGGLAARAFVQRRVPSSMRDLVRALLTTGTPHKGSPIGRLYNYLETCHVNSSILDAATCISDLATVEIFKSLLDLRRPGVSYLGPESPDILALAQTEPMLGTLKTVMQTYYAKPIGHLWGSSYLWEMPGRLDINVFSNASKNFALCGNYTIASCNKTAADMDFWGDGIVPWQSQNGLTARAELSHFTNHTGRVFHTGETGRIDDLNKLIKEVPW